METEAVIRYCRSCLDWFLSVFREWIILACGGIIMAGWWAYSNCRGKSMSPQQFMIVAGLFIFLASFKAWKRERDKVLDLSQTIKDKDAEIRSIRNSKRDKASDAITQHISAIMERISAIIGKGPMNYNSDKDEETHSVLAGIHGWVIAELNQEGQTLYCSGVLDIHGSDIFQGEFSTMQERNYAEMIDRLRRRMTNLKAIKDNLDNYLPK
jgi:hypothetical protein